MGRLNEEIRRNRELMGLQEQSSAARKIGYRTCNGSLSSSVHNILVNGNSPQVGDIITITDGGQTRTVFVTSVSTANNTNHPLQDVPCETSCPNCQNSNCWNMTTGQPCSACDNDPNCWHDGSNTTTPVLCDSCGCAGVPGITQTYGCTDSSATNYDPNATCDDGSCIALPDDWFCINNTCQSYPGGTFSNTNWQQFPNVTGLYPTEADCLAACGQTTSPCSALTQPIGGSNWQPNVQTHGWETTFTCLIENANNPCSLLRKKIDDMNAQLQKPFFQNNQTHHDRVTQHIAFAQNLGNSTHDCDNLQNLSPGDDTNLTSGTMNWNKPQWESEFTDTVNDHANPCNFLQNRITAWETKLDTLSEWNTSWVEMLNFKIDHAESLQTINNC
jgi:hypothetical protein